MLNGEGSLGEGLVSAVAHSHVSKPLHTAMRWRMEWAVGGGAWRCQWAMTRVCTSIGASVQAPSTRDVNGSQPHSQARVSE